MSKKPKKPRSRKRLLRNLAVGTVVFLAFLLLFVAAFIFNPLEGSVRDVRDLVPRGVNFFARKALLADDFYQFPEPAFWTGLTESIGYQDLADGPLAQELRNAGLERAVQQLRDAVEQVDRDSGGWVNVVDDLIGTEVVVAGYMQDYSRSPAQPLAEPRWCAYMRVSWRIKAALGLAGFGFVQGQAEQSGVAIASDGDLLVITLPGAAGPLYLKRHLDVLMASNDKGILEASQRLIDGNRDEEPLGQMAAYTDGAVGRIEEWASDNSIIQPNVLEFVVEPNTFGGFEQLAQIWPNAAHNDSMNERVLASFLNLKGWQLLSGGLMFERSMFAATGQIVLNSKQHSGFQRSFYTAESKPREQWLYPFLQMVPKSACAAVGMRMPVGDFLHAMFGAMEPEERELINEMLRRSTYQNEQLADINDLIERLRIAFLPRAGFVFRRNIPDMSRDENGQLNVPVANRSPMPQVAWVFWLRPGSEPMLEELILMLRNSPGNFYIKKVWHLRVPFGQGQTLREPVTEFCNPQIPATGEVAMMVFREFFVVSNSGPLIKDVLRTYYSVDGMQSIILREKFDLFERELPSALNGFVWLNGQNLVEVFDDYLQFAEASSEEPDPGFLESVRGPTEEEVRRTKYPSYRSKASIPQDVLRGEFEAAVQAAMREKWRKERTNYTAADLGQMRQLRAMAQLLDVGYMQLELMNNFIRFQLKLLLNID